MTILILALVSVFVVSVARSVGLMLCTDDAERAHIHLTTALCYASIAAGILWHVWSTR